MNLDQWDPTADDALDALTQMIDQYLLANNLQELVQWGLDDKGEVKFMVTGIGNFSLAIRLIEEFGLEVFLTELGDHRDLTPYMQQRLEILCEALHQIYRLNKIQ